MWGVLSMSFLVKHTKLCVQGVSASQCLEGVKGVLFFMRKHPPWAILNPMGSITVLEREQAAKWALLETVSWHGDTFFVFLFFSFFFFP